MYPNKLNILELAALMLKFEIKHVVISPGSRNAPLSQTFASNEKFTCYSITDERSAAFFALGLAQSLRQPVVVCCTSGSALLNILPAVSEAYYQQLPLLVISADRPAEWIGQMDGQTIHQANIAPSIFKKSVHLPEIKDDTDKWFCNRLINEALLSLNHRVSGPVHINIPLSEPLFDFSVLQLPEVRKIERIENRNDHLILPDQLEEQWKNAKRPLILVGQQPYDKEINRALRLLQEKSNCVILAEQIANIQDLSHSISNFDSVLYTYSDHEDLVPDLVIYLGGHIVSKRLKAFIRKKTPCHLWFVSQDGEIVDTFQNLSTIIEANPLSVIQALCESSRKLESTYLNTWMGLSNEIEEHSQSYSFTQFSDLFVIKSIIERLPSSNLQLANSSVVRNVQLFTLNKAKEVHANRGTSGIEGSMSTAVGYSVAREELTYLLIGDLSFFYDMNALWNKYLSCKLRILVVNNGNGQIFNTLGGLEKSEIRSEFIAASHHSSVKAWVEDRGCFYFFARNKDELDMALSIFCDEKKNTKHPIVLEVFTDSDINTSELKAYYKHLKNK